MPSIFILEDWTFIRREWLDIYPPHLGKSHLVYCVPGEKMLVNPLSISSITDFKRMRLMIYRIYRTCILQCLYYLRLNINKTKVNLVKKGREFFNQVVFVFNKKMVVIRKLIITINKIIIEYPNFRGYKGDI